MVAALFLATGGTVFIGSNLAPCPLRRYPHPRATVPNRAGETQQAKPGLEQLIQQIEKLGRIDNLRDRPVYEIGEIAYNDNYICHIGADALGLSAGRNPLILIFFNERLHRWPI